VSLTIFDSASRSAASRCSSPLLLTLQFEARGCQAADSAPCFRKAGEADPFLQAPQGYSLRFRVFEFLFELQANVIPVLARRCKFLVKLRHPHCFVRSADCSCSSAVRCLCSKPRRALSQLLRSASCSSLAWRCGFGLLQGILQRRPLLFRRLPPLLKFLPMLSQVPRSAFSASVSCAMRIPLPALQCCAGLPLPVVCAQTRPAEPPVPRPALHPGLRSGRCGLRTPARHSAATPAAPPPPAPLLNSAGAFQAPRSAFSASVSCAMRDSASCIAVLRWSSASFVCAQTRPQSSSSAPALHAGLRSGRCGLRLLQGILQRRPLLFRRLPPLLKFLPVFSQAPRSAFSAS